MRNARPMLAAVNASGFEATMESDFMTMASLSDSLAAEASQRRQTEDHLDFPGHAERNLRLCNAGYDLEGSRSDT